jgi:hypothetical protein
MNKINNPFASLSHKFYYRHNILQTMPKKVKFMLILDRIFIRFTNPQVNSIFPAINETGYSALWLKDLLWKNSDTVGARPLFKNDSNTGEETLHELVEFMKDVVLKINFMRNHVLQDESISTDLNNTDIENLCFKCLLTEGLENLIRELTNSSPLYASFLELLGNHISDNDNFIKSYYESLHKESPHLKYDTSGILPEVSGAVLMCAETDRTIMLVKLSAMLNDSEGKKGDCHPRSIVSPESYPILFLLKSVQESKLSNQAIDLTQNKSSTGLLITAIEYSIINLDRKSLTEVGQEHNCLNNKTYERLYIAYILIPSLIKFKNQLIAG